MKNVFFLVLICLISSCITVSINTNDYEFLSYSEKEYLRPFEHAKLYSAGDNKNCFKLFEVNTENVKSIIEEQEITWLHIWVPYCPNESCTSISQYESFEKQYKSNGLNLAFISATYDMDNIIKIVQQSNFTKPVYVLKSSYFGVKNKKIRTKFHSELDPTFNEEEDLVFHSDYLFVKDSLVYAGPEMNDSIIREYISITE